MQDSNDIRMRKLDHILITSSKEVESSETLLEEIQLIHQALPEIDFSEVSIETEFLGKKLSAPIIITGMTGGHPLGGEINSVLAKVAEKQKIAMGVGSQRAALEDPSLVYSYRVARDNAPSIPLIANIGAQQLLSPKGFELAERAVEMIEADALAIHLNPAQEAFQAGGDTSYRGIIERISGVAEKLSVPVIVKETGCGISLETALKIFEAGVDIIDISGAGGTSWIVVEGERSRRSGETMLWKASKTFKDWGIPTALSLIEVRHTIPNATIIASGGIRTGLDIAKSIALGANYAGLALPMLRKALESTESLEKYVEQLKYELKTAMFLTGSKSFSDLKKKPLVLSTKIINWLVQRGVDPKEYLEKRRRGTK